MEGCDDGYILSFQSIPVSALSRFFNFFDIKYASRFSDDVCVSKPSITCSSVSRVFGSFLSVVDTSFGSTNSIAYGPTSFATGLT